MCWNLPQTIPFPRVQVCGEIVFHKTHLWYQKFGDACRMDKALHDQVPYFSPPEVL